MSERCSRQLFRGSWFHPSHCRQPAKVQRDGQWYCTQHDPERVKAKRAKKEAERSREFDLRRLRGLIHDALLELGNLVCGPSFAVRSPDEQRLIDRVASLRAKLAKLEGETT